MLGSVPGLLCGYGILSFMIHTALRQDTSLFFFSSWILTITTWAPGLSFRTCGILCSIDLCNLGRFCAKASSTFYRITTTYASPYATGVWTLFVLRKSDHQKRHGLQCPVKGQPPGSVMDEEFRFFTSSKETMVREAHGGHRSLSKGEGLSKAVGCRLHGRKRGVALKPGPHTIKVLAVTHRRVLWKPWPHTLPSTVATVDACSVEPSHKFRWGYNQSQQRSGPNCCVLVVNYETAAFSEQGWLRQTFHHKRKSLLGFLDITGESILCFQMWGTCVAHELGDGSGTQFYWLGSRAVM